MNDLNDNSSEVVFGPAERGFVYAVARRIVPTESDAEDVTQDAMLLAYRHRAAFRGEARYRTWLYRIASTTALGHLRKAKRSRERLHALAENDEAPDVLAPDPTPEQETASREELARIESAVSQLPATYRDVMAMRAGEHSEQEIANQLGITVANVKIRTHRARARLREAVAR